MDSYYRNRCRIAYFNWLRQNRNTGIKLTEDKKRKYWSLFFSSHLFTIEDARRIEQCESEDYSKGEREYINWESFPKIDPPLKEFAPRKLIKHDGDD